MSVPDRQPVGICTVQRSSEDSSVEVPMKSNVKQLRTSCSVWLSRPCCSNTKTREIANWNH